MSVVGALGILGVGLEVAAAGVVINEFDQLTQKRTDGTKRKSSKRRTRSERKIREPSFGLNLEPMGLEF